MNQAITDYGAFLREAMQAVTVLIEMQQREAALVFNTKIAQLSSRTEQEKAFHDIVVAVKRNSLEYFGSLMGADMSALNQVIEGKKALEELSKTHISLD